MDIDQLRETELQSSIFRIHEDENDSVDLNRLGAVLKQESKIPDHAVDQAIRHIRQNLEHLGMTHPPPGMIVHWLTGLLRQQGFSLGEVSLQTLELSLNDVELSIYHPLGTGAAAGQNPEATSQKIARRIKAQFASRKVFQEEVIQAHDEGLLELLHLGAVDRPHDIILTPDYLKISGLPSSIGAPNAGAAKRADVLLSHLIRFTHELQNHFAGDIRWTYLNTLLLPFLDEMNEKDLAQFAQQMLFEFAQLDVERGGIPRKVILDLDLDMPRHVESLTAMGPGGVTGILTYNQYARTLHRFNEVFLDILAAGDAHGNPFHSPQIIFHLNGRDTSWNTLLQQLFATAFKFGNPLIAFSQQRRDLGPLGVKKINDPDFMRMVCTPAELRGFSSSTVALNLPRLVDPTGNSDFVANLEHAMDLTVTAHRQKRLFISRLMAFGNRGPLQFLRHKIDDRPFLKIDQATQPLQVIGLGEAAALRNGSPGSPAEAIGLKAAEILHTLGASLAGRNKVHKLTMHLTGTRSENLAYRFALLDMRKYSSELSSYLLRRTEQSHPVYSEGANILAFHNLRRRDRMAVEADLHRRMNGSHNHIIYLRGGRMEDPGLLQKIYRDAADLGISQLQLAPDMTLCLSCYRVNTQSGEDKPCHYCNSSRVVDYGLCQANFSPVHTWCLGKRAEWKIRRRLDDYSVPVQTQLPL